jgi:hypothetical protein
MRNTLLTLVFSWFCFGLLDAQPAFTMDDAIHICNKNLYKISTTEGLYAPDVDDTGITCFANAGDNGPMQSAWIMVRAKTPGLITFTITPGVDNDLDFVVFAITEDGKPKTAIRCMAAGSVERGPCTGATGLRLKEKDKTEDAGCSDTDDNNWLAPLTASAGQEFAILVLNVSKEPVGCTFQIGGTAGLECEAR